MNMCFKFSSLSCNEILLGINDVITFVVAKGGQQFCAKKSINKRGVGHLWITTCNCKIEIFVTRTLVWTAEICFRLNCRPSPQMTSSSKSWADSMCLIRWSKRVKYFWWQTRPCRPSCRPCDGHGFELEGDPFEWTCIGSSLPQQLPVHLPRFLLTNIPGHSDSSGLLFCCSRLHLLVFSICMGSKSLPGGVQFRSFVLLEDDCERSRICHLDNICEMNL